MGRGRSINSTQESIVIEQYNDGAPIKKIMEATEIRSEQTIYRILDDHRVPRRPRLNGVQKKVFTVEMDVAKILVKVENKSAYINEAIRFYQKSLK